MNNLFSTVRTTRASGKQRGFTMVELLVVLAIIAVLAIIGVPAARGIIVGGKVEPTAGDINKVVAKVRGNYAGNGSSPYATITTAVFSTTARGMTSAVSVSGAAMSHDIGAAGSQVTVAPSTIGTAGDSFAVTLPTVNEAACPGLASALSKAAEVITINGTSVKAVNGAYAPTTAQTACAANDANTFVFTFR